METASRRASPINPVLQLDSATTKKEKKMTPLLLATTYPGGAFAVLSAILWLLLTVLAPFPLLIRLFWHVRTLCWPLVCHQKSKVSQLGRYHCVASSYPGVVLGWMGCVFAAGRQGVLFRAVSGQLQKGCCKSNRVGIIVATLPSDQKKSVSRSTGLRIV